LREITEATGGSAVVLERRASEISPVTDVLMNEVHNRYTMVYTTRRPERDGALHKIAVKVDKQAEVSKLKVLMRRKYYAPFQ
jgi:hypothetical protein